MGVIGSSILASPFDFHDPVGITRGSHKYWIPESSLGSSSVCFLGGLGMGCCNAYCSQKKKIIQEDIFREEIKENAKD